MILKNKNALAYFKLVALFVAIVFLVVMIMFIQQSVAKSKYETSLVMCNQFFKNIEGKPTYFSPTYDKITGQLVDSIAQLCPSKDVEITNKNIKPALDLMQDCWFKTGGGADIMPLTGKDLGICVYCGKISTKENIEGFGDKMKKGVKDDKYSSLISLDAEVVNLNIALFGNSYMPSSFSEDTEYALFYYTSKPPVFMSGDLGTDVTLWYKDKIAGGVRDFIGESFDVGPLFNYYVLDSLMIGNITKTTGGLVLIKQDKMSEEAFSEIKNNIANRGCFVVFPEEEY